MALSGGPLFRAGGALLRAGGPLFWTGGLSLGGVFRGGVCPTLLLDTL